MISFAIKTLACDRGKLATGLIGVVFSLVLVNVQGGLYLGLMHKASVLIDDCDADFWIGHRLLENVDFAHDIPSAWQNRIRGLSSVERVDEYIVSKGVATLTDGGFEDVWLIGSDPATMRGSGWRFTAGSRDDLRRPHAVSIDEVDARKLGHPRIGEWLEVNGRRAKVVASTQGITGFVTTPYLFTTVNTARELSGVREGYCSYLLVKARPGADLAETRSQITGLVPDGDVFTPGDLARLSQNYWTRRTGIGASFGAATALGLLVGLLMVAQSLYALALDHLHDYATLKAIGADDRYVCRVIIVQALAVASGGSIAGLAVIAAIVRFWNSPLAPIEIPPALGVAGVLMIFVMCLAASMLPFIRVRQVEPAIVLQG